MSNAMMRVSTSWGSYNERRYSRPWIGKITSWPIGGKAEIEWGSYLGDDHGGECEIMAVAGDIVRSGQKDGRGNCGSNEWFVVQADGELLVVNQADARKAWDARAKAAETAKADPLASIPDDQLVAALAARGYKIERPAPAVA